MTTDRIMATLCAFLVLVCAWITFETFNQSWSWVLLPLWTFALAVWWLAGGNTIDIGWKGKLLFIGEPQEKEFGAGWHWTPWPFGLEKADFRKQVDDLDVLECVTADNVPVFVGGAVAHRISDFDQYLEIDPEDLLKWIKTTREELIRAAIRLMPQANALGSNQTLGEDVTTALRGRSADWGIEILEVIVPQVTPDPEVAKDLALQAREKLQREGQKIEALHMAAMYKFFAGTEPLEENGPAGPNLSPELAHEAALLAVGKATPKTLASNTLGIDRATVAAIIEAVRSKQ